MSVGYTKTKADVDQRAGTIALDVRSVMDRASSFKAVLDTLTDTDLEGLGYTAGEVAILRSGTNDLAQLATIYTGAAALAVAKDFRTFAKLFTGVV